MVCVADQLCLFDRIVLVDRVDRDDPVGRNPCELADGGIAMPLHIAIETPNASAKD